jgi:hypothetical protein
MIQLEWEGFLRLECLMAMTSHHCQIRELENWTGFAAAIWPAVTFFFLPTKAISTTRSFLTWSASASLQLHRPSFLHYRFYVITFPQLRHMASIKLAKNSLDTLLKARPSSKDAKSGITKDASKRKQKLALPPTKTGLKKIKHEIRYGNQKKIRTKAKIAESRQNPVGKQYGADYDRS